MLIGQIKHKNKINADRGGHFFSRRANSAQMLNFSEYKNKIDN